MPTAPFERQVTRRRLGRILLGLCIGCPGLLILGVTLLPYIIALERVQDMLVSRVEAALQHQVTIGAVRLQTFTGLEVTLEDVTLDPPPGWVHSPLLRIGTLSVQVARRALLQRTVAITKMIVRDAEFVIERDPQGHLNVADLATSPLAQVLAPCHEAAPAEATPPGVKPLASWLIADVGLEGVTVTFVDRMGVPGKGVTTTLRDVRGHLRNISSKTPIPFDLTATALSDGHHNLRVQGRIGPIPAPLGIGRAPIEAELQATDLHLGSVPSYLGGRLPMERGRVGADLKVKGMMGEDLRIAGALSLVEDARRDPTRDETATRPPLLVSAQKVTLNLANASIQIAEAQLDLFGLHATLTGVVTDVHTSPRFDLQLTSNTFSPGGRLAQIPLLAPFIPAHAELLGRAQLEATVSGPPHTLRAEAQLEVNKVAFKSGGILVELDSPHVSLTTDLAEPRPPQIKVVLRARRLVVDQCEANAPLPAAMPPSGPPPPAPQALPRLPRATLNGTVKITEGRIQRVRFQQLMADVAFAQDHLRIAHQATVYGGSYRGVAQVNLARREPAYTLNARVVGAQLSAAMHTWTASDTVRQGVLTTQINLSGRGWTWLRLRQTLRGDGQATITKLKTRPPDPMHVWTRKVTLVSPLGNMSRRIRVQHEAIHTVKAILHMRQGYILSDDLQLWGKDLAIQAKGYLGLDRSIAYNGTLALSGERASTQGILAKLFVRDPHGRIIYPFAVKGVVSDPQIVVNVKDLLGRSEEGLADLPK